MTSRPSHSARAASAASDARPGSPVAAQPAEGLADEPGEGLTEPAGRAARLLATVVESTGGGRRDGQEAMARAVAAAVDTGRHLLVQAGTGTGKSWGYLVPAVAAAVREDVRVVVATSTLALQAQLVRHDLPRVADALAGALGRRPTWQLLKGRHHYACRHRLGGGDGDGETGVLWPDPDDPAAGGARSGLEEAVARIRRWAQDTESGDRDELVPGVPERAWRAMSVTSRECLGPQRCPEAAECFSEAARQRAREVDLVVTNHALLAIDAAEHRSTLPPHDVVVVDEGHDLVDRVTAALSVELGAAAVRSAAASARRAGTDPRDLDQAADRLDEVLEQLPAGRLPTGVPAAVEDALVLVTTAARSATRAVSPDSGSGTDRRTGAQQSARAALLELVAVAERLAGLEQVAAGADTAGRDPEGADAAGAGTAGADTAGRHPTGRGATGDDAVGPPEASGVGRDVVWLDRDERRGSLLRAAPLSVAGLLGARLFADRAVVVTSATLAGPGGFPALARRLGAGPEGWDGVDVGSPFDYRRQGILYVAAHLPPPGRQGHGDPLHDELVALVEAAGGRTLGLFSSRRAAETAADVVRERCDVPVLCQGDDLVGALVRDFAADEAACLFGTLGLWQGVDVPGAACSLVVLDRIPFPRPDDPLSQARSEAADAAGASGFLAVSVSHAATLLAQGAGRLIRSPSDRGVVAVLDSRLVTRRYGGALLAGLPDMWRTTDRAVALAALRRLAAGRTATAPAGTDPAASDPAAGGRPAAGRAAAPAPVQ